jgi:hypothetical protein
MIEVQLLNKSVLCMLNTVVIHNVQNTASSFFRDVTHRGWVVYYRRFGTTDRSHLQKSSRALKMGPIGCPETSVTNHKSKLVTSHKSEYLIYTAVAAWNNIWNIIWWDMKGKTEVDRRIILNWMFAILEKAWTVFILLRTRTNRQLWWAR